MVRLRDGGYDEVWVHGMWLPREWRACWNVLAIQASNLKRQTSNVKPSLIRMTHGSLSPIYLERQGKWKKRLVGPIERWLLRRADRVVATCEAEKRWIEAYLGKRRPEIVVEDLKRFFDFSGTSGEDAASPLSCGNGFVTHVLYLGRRHPLKGVNYLEQAVEELNQSFEHSEHSEQSNNRTIDLRIVSDHFGEELEKDWEWCDVLALPTLSENFGRVVAEALERGKRVVTTDGAPAWGDEVKVKGEGEQWRSRLVYLRGYRDGTDEERVQLLKNAIAT